MEKRGQLTIFIIIAVVIVVIAGLFFAFRGGLNLNSPFSISQTEDINSFITACVEEISADAIKQIGKGGGYYLSPENSILGLTIYSNGEEIFIPSKLKVQEEISAYISENLLICANNFVNFPEVEIEQGNIDVVTIIEKTNVNFDISYPISITNGEETNVLNNFDNQISTKLGLIYDSLEDLVENNKNSICLTCSLENDLRIEIDNLDQNNTIFIIVDENSKLNEENLEWIFVMNYEND